MRILQLIDSLDAGGAERMAVNYANALSETIALSAMVVTRKEGVLKNELSDKVPYLFLQRKKTIDVQSIKALLQFVKKHQIEWIHAHGSSFFIASLLKILYPKIKLVWHDHNGNRVKIKMRENTLLAICSYLFNAVITVNRELQTWAEKNLHSKKIAYLPNFTRNNGKEEKATILQGNPEKRIVCLANLRHPKNHVTLIAAFHATKLAAEGWTLHLVGKDNFDDYSGKVKEIIRQYGLTDSVFILDSKSDVYHILSQASIGVLSSTYEGFPVTLLEYGLSKLAVVASNVGYCPEVITDSEDGFLFNPLNAEQLSGKLLVLAKNEALREKFGDSLYKSVGEKFSQQSVIATYLNLIN
ncbi:glycosyltransferase [Flavobacterium enshiense]|uniref:glycosyltransferase n=1 Tax=Flavobacterium enshiense TaxID=1341165 RepID=UPI00345CDB72